MTLISSTPEDIAALHAAMAPAEVIVLGTLRHVRHEMSPHNSFHRLVHITGVAGEWASYQQIATLSVGNIDTIGEEKFIGATDYYRGVLPEISWIVKWKDHATN